MKLKTGFDYVIVGAGSAGCTLANRLTEDADASVLVIEAGGSDSHPYITIPLGFGKILFERRFDWGYFTEPEPQLDGRQVECARGKVIGGSSSVNAMSYVRGHHKDYDHWSKNGCQGWSFAECLPYFKKSETWEKGGDHYRGDGGPLSTTENKYPDPLLQAWLHAGQAAGFKITTDYNGTQNEGLGIHQSTTRNGRRHSAAHAYLHPAMKRPNLTVISNALAHRVVLKETKAIGIEYCTGNSTTIAYASREVIISAGVINSPQLLMLSGIGDPAHLRSHGVDVRVDLKGVGQNLRDHLAIDVQYERIGDGPFVNLLRYDRITLAMMQAYFCGTGFATEMPGPLTGFISSREGLTQPNLQLLSRFIPPESRPWFPGIRRKPKDAFMVRAVMLHPKSVGYVALRSSNPRDHMRIFQNFLSDPGDWETMREGVSIIKDIANQEPLDKFRGAEIRPANEPIDEYIKREAKTAHHPLGTCQMGATCNPSTVVDPQLCILGVENLRVVDASVFPTTIGGNLNAPIIMMAERISDLIRGREPLAPIHTVSSSNDMARGDGCDID